jgi:methylmalonyl-CoA/ethylmalonyl-CoA epimerase
MNKLQFHHMGIACRMIQQEADVWIAMGYEQEGEPFEDEHQGVAGQFLVGVGPRLEILQPLQGRTVLDSYLSSGTKVYHHGFETADIDLAINDFRTKRAKLISPPSPSVAFDGRRIAFMLFPNMYLVELIELGNEND